MNINMPDSNSNILFSTYQLNSRFNLKNRIVMAPMTRAKADDNLAPTLAMADYYSRRADAGLIITEATVISSDASGYPNIPGIFNDAQIAGWQTITNAVHARDGLIFSQLWHVGRVSHPIFLNGQLPISASETTMSGRVSRSPGLTYGKSRAASLDEIQIITDNYVQAAINAIRSGFDGVEIHGANGYLIDQFLHYNTNKRTDEFGGSPENMARFPLNIVKAIGAAIGYDRVGIRLSPAAHLHEIIGDERDGAIFEYLLKQLNHLPIAYVHTGSFDDAVTHKELQDKTMTAFIRSYFKGTVIASGSYTSERAQQGIRDGEFDLTAFGRPFIANPDFIERTYQGKILTDYNANMLDTLY